MWPANGKTRPPVLPAGRLEPLRHPLKASLRHPLALSESPDPNLVTRLLLEDVKERLVVLRWPHHGLLFCDHDLSKALLEPLTAHHDVRGMPAPQLRRTRERHPRAHRLDCPYLRVRQRPLLP